MSLAGKVVCRLLITFANSFVPRSAPIEYQASSVSKLFDTDDFRKINESILK